jgi:uncharacterized membrane protein
MVNRIPLSRMAFWGAWVLAGMVGTGLPYLATAAGWLGPVYADQDVWIAILVNSGLVAFPQYIVLRLLIHHSSLAGAMWIPVSAVASLAADLAIYASADRIANALFSVGAIQALMGPFPFVNPISVIIAVQAITLAAVLGLAQGLLLARVFAARSAARLWFVGNLVAAVVILIVTLIRMNVVSTQTNQTAVDLLLEIAILGGLYAAVTGIALVAVSRRYSKSAGSKSNVPSADE